MRKKIIIPIIAVMICTIITGVQNINGQSFYHDNITGEWIGNDYNGGDWAYGTNWVISGTKGYSRYTTDVDHMSYVTIGNITASSQWVSGGVRSDANRISNYGAVANRCGIENVR